MLIAAGASSPSAAAPQSVVWWWRLQGVTGARTNGPKLNLRTKISPNIGPRCYLLSCWQSSRLKPATSAALLVAFTPNGTRGSNPARSAKESAILRFHFALALSPNCHQSRGRVSAPVAAARSRSQHVGLMQPERELPGIEEAPHVKRQRPDSPLA